MRVSSNSRSGWSSDSTMTLGSLAWASSIWRDGAQVSTEHTAALSALVPGQGDRQTYGNPCGGAEAGASVVPVIVAEFVDLDAFLIRRLMGHGLCHHQRFRAALGGNPAGRDGTSRDGRLVPLRAPGIRLADECEGRRAMSRPRPGCASFGRDRFGRQRWRRKVFAASDVGSSDSR